MTRKLKFSEMKIVTCFLKREKKSENQSYWEQRNTLVQGHQVKFLLSTISAQKCSYIEIAQQILTPVNDSKLNTS